MKKVLKLTRLLFIAFCISLSTPAHAGDYTVYYNGDKAEIWSRDSPLAHVSSNGHVKVTITTFNSLEFTTIREANRFANHLAKYKTKICEWASSAFNNKVYIDKKYYNIPAITLYCLDGCGATTIPTKLYLHTGAWFSYGFGAGLYSDRDGCETELFVSYSKESFKARLDMYIDLIRVSNQVFTELKRRENQMFH